MNFNTDTEDPDVKMKRFLVRTILIVWGLFHLGVFFVDGAEENKLLYHLQGTLDMAIGTIIAFYLGSSKSSQDKDKKSRQDETTPDDIRP